MGRLRAFRPRAAPVSVAKLWEDLWLGAIRHSNSVIAGFPRNVFKYGGLAWFCGVVEPYAQGKPRHLELPNTRGGLPRQAWAR